MTEAIGYMYEDEYDPRDSRRLSYAPSPQGESISTVPRSRSNTSDDKFQDHSGNDSHEQSSDGPSRPSSAKSPSSERDQSSSPSRHQSPSDTATSSFPLNDIDYESNPAAVAQELSNLAAIRRMSMDVTNDPDLPSFGPDFQVPSIAPSSSADENDTSRLFWVPARLHPELAPKEFKSFLESKAELIRRKSGEFSALGKSLESQGSGGLRRKPSMLSKQINDSSDYTDGAERLERKRSQSRQGQESSGPNLQQLEKLVDTTRQYNKEALALLGGLERVDINDSEDKPILPPAPPGHSLKRSTRTQYRKGSMKKGERLPYSKRIGRTPETLGGQPPSASMFEEQPPIKPLTRSSTDPGRGTFSERAAERATERATDRTTDRATTSGRTVASDDSTAASPPSKSTALPPGSTPQSTFESMLDKTSQQVPQPHQDNRLSSRGSLPTTPSSRNVPHAVETPPAESTSQPAGHQQTFPQRTVSHSASSSVSSLPTPVSNNASKQKRTRTFSNPVQTLGDIASRPSAIPGNSTRTDSLSLIPTLTEDKDKRTESKKSKDKKDSEGGRKSSWHWLRGSEDKEKKKDKDRDSEGKKSKSRIPSEKQDSSLANSADGGSSRRESLILERPLDPRLEEERRKESARKASGESKKEKESGLLSSIFGGGKKKSGGDHKKQSSRTLSPERPSRPLIPDKDYPWTRFSILEERAIYRMAHIKLANPRRPLYSQVLLSNFMYSYLAKVQQMHPQLAIPTSPAQRVQQQQAQKDGPAEYTQYQQYHEVCLCSLLSENGINADQTQEYGNHGYDGYAYSDGTSHGYENGGQRPYDGGYSSFGEAAQMDSDDDMW